MEDLKKIHDMNLQSEYMVVGNCRTIYKDEVDDTYY